MAPDEQADHQEPSRRVQSCQVKSSQHNLGLWYSIRMMYEYIVWGFVMGLFGLFFFVFRRFGPFFFPFGPFVLRFSSVLLAFFCLWRISVFLCGVNKNRDR